MKEVLSIIFFNMCHYKLKNYRKTTSEKLNQISLFATGIFFLLLDRLSHRVKEVKSRCSIDIKSFLYCLI